MKEADDEDAPVDCRISLTLSCLAHVGGQTSAPTEDLDEQLIVTPIRPYRRPHGEKRPDVPSLLGGVEVDMTGIVRLRDELKTAFQECEGVSLSYLAFTIKAVVQALAENPILNSTWAGDRIILKKDIHVGMAVATDEGLIVPVIKDAAGKSITSLAREINGLIAGARDGKPSLDTVQGGTFTVNNSGALGTLFSMPIINQPQAAILNTDAIMKRPIALENDAIAVRSMMYMSLAFDHRILDGMVAARFLGRIKTLLESYGPGTAID